MASHGGMGMLSLQDLEREAGLLTDQPAWRALEHHAASIAGSHLRQLLAEPVRFDILSRRSGSFVLDLTRQRFTAETLGLLVKLARERHLERWIEALFSGEAVNTTENRPALHMALRLPPGRVLPLAGTDIMPEVLRERDRMLELAEGIRSGRIRGHNGARLRHVVNIGIGGSDLGLVMACEALRPLVHPDLVFHFVSNIDGTQLTDVLRVAQPAETLFVVCSKSFTTLETSLNADAARTWLLGHLGEPAVASHFVAISVNDAAMDRFGIAPDRRFRLWDWVGGRYSLWSSIGLTLAIAIGAEPFRQLLAGGHAMDEHFRTARLADNLPALLGLAAVWNQNFQGTTTHCILPYDGRLHRFAAYLQQLEMESNGKGVTRDGRPVAVPTGTVIWGEPGSNAQHSFGQLLHQGTARFSVDFMAPVHGSGSFPDQHRHGLANMLAQAEALARGYRAGDVQRELRARGISGVELDRQVPHRVHPGDHPSSVLLFERLDPYHLGGLVALYEHKVFVQAVVWGTNPFDQWGVELGKQMAAPIHAALAGDGANLPPLGVFLTGLDGRT